MKPLLIILAITAASFAAPPTKPPVGVPADAKFFNGKWYRVYLEKAQWNRAQERCKALGGQLVIVPNAETWAFVKALSPASVWLGATDEKAEGVWLWVDGTPLKYSDWFAEQPDNAAGAEHYLATWRGVWNDVPRNGSFGNNQVAGFICEWPAK